MRTKHQENVRYLKQSLTHFGLPQLPSPSHIIPIPVGDPWWCTWLSNQMLTRYGHYVQSINYPTVPQGQERLRVAPTPFHTRAMIDQFVGDLQHVWTEAGYSLHKDKCSTQSCYFCHKPLKRFEEINEIVYPCGVTHGCPQMIEVN